MNLVRGNVLVTGATGGIGQAIARAFAARGASLILTGRRTEVLQPLAAEVGGRVLTCDLSDRAEVEKLYDEKGEVSWGNQIRNYVLQPYTLAKDVRTEVQTAKVGEVLDGDLDDFVQAYLRHKAERQHKKG